MALSSDDRRSQIVVFEQAMSIYEEREQVRGGNWKQFGIEDVAHHLRNKSSRIETAVKLAYEKLEAGDMSGREEVIAAIADDLLDTINYAAFGIRHLQGENDGK